MGDPKGGNNGGSLKWGTPTFYFPTRELPFFVCQDRRTSKRHPPTGPPQSPPPPWRSPILEGQKPEILKILEDTPAPMGPLQNHSQHPGVPPLTIPLLLWGILRLVPTLGTSLSSRSPWILPAGMIWGHGGQRHPLVSLI